MSATRDLTPILTPVGNERGISVAARYFMPTGCLVLLSKTSVQFRNGLLLHGLRNVSIDSQRDRDVTMAQTFLDHACIFSHF